MRIVVDSRGVIQSNPEELTTLTVRGTLTATSMSLTAPLFPKYGNLYVYVNEASGNDYNDGFSLGSPVRTVEKAFEKVNQGYSGDGIIYFASGTYTTASPLVLPYGQVDAHSKPLILSGTLQAISSNLGIISASSGSTSTTITPWARSVLTFDSTFSQPPVNSLRGAFLIMDSAQLRLNGASGSYVIAENTGSTITLHTALGTGAGSLATSGSTCTIYVPASRIHISGVVNTRQAVAGGNITTMIGQGNVIATNNIIFSINENPPGNTNDTTAFWENVNLMPCRTWYNATPDNVRNRITIQNSSIRRQNNGAPSYIPLIYPTLTGAFDFAPNMPTIVWNSGLGNNSKTAGCVNTFNYCSIIELANTIIQDHNFNVISCNQITYSDVSIYGFAVQSIATTANTSFSQIFSSNITFSSNSTTMFSVGGPSRTTFQNWHISGWDGSAAGSTAVYLKAQQGVNTFTINNIFFQNFTNSTNAAIRLDGGVHVLGPISASNIAGYGLLICSGANVIASTAGTTTVISGALGEVYVGSNTAVSTWSAIATNVASANTDFSASVPQFTTIRK